VVLRKIRRNITENHANNLLSVRVKTEIRDRALMLLLTVSRDLFLW